METYGDIIQRNKTKENAGMAAFALSQNVEHLVQKGVRSGAPSQSPKWGPGNNEEIVLAKIGRKVENI